MRYSREHKAESRKRILATTSRRMKKQGLAESSIANIMRDAGLTHGAFYGHFKSREHLVREVFEASVDATISSLLKGQSTEQFSDVASKYLSRSHRDNPGSGCALAIFAEEIRRGGKATRSAFAVKLGQMANAMAELLGESPGPDRRASALAALSVLAGGILLSRACKGNKISDEVLDAACALATQIPRISGETGAEWREERPDKGAT